MSHNFVPGDTVRIGKGKVEYTVADAHLQTPAYGKVAVQSNNTGKFQEVDGERLVMVKAFVSTPKVTVEVVEGLVLMVDGKIVKSKGSFETLAFALSRLKGTYTVASILRDGAAVVTRNAA